jgi:hypothetical protein
MPALSLAPRFSITADRLHGCTPWFARLLTFFSYGRCVSVNRSLGHLIVSTQKLWISQQVRIINFERISHIVYRAQALPSLAPWRYLFDTDAFSSGWAFFIVSLALKGETDEVSLFTIWQMQPRTPDVLDKLAGDGDLDTYVGDEAARSLVDSLVKMTGAHVAAE